MADKQIFEPFDYNELRDSLVKGDPNFGAPDQSVDELIESTYRDGLTGLYNRKYFNEQVKELNKTPNKQYSIFMIDIDNFKNLNDTFGHQAGDSALKRAANFLEDHVRETDTVCRYGGEEFAIIFEGTDGVEERAEGLRKAIESSHSIKVDQRHIKDEADLIPLTISVGVSRHFSDSELSVEKIISEADGALYRAKDGGRNQVVVAE